MSYWGYQPGQSRDQLPADPVDPAAPPPQDSDPFPLWLGFALGPALALIFLLLILFT